MTPVFVLSWGCRKAEDPQAVSDRITQIIQHGDLKTASLQADTALAQFGESSPEWLWRFRILKARILVFQSAPKEALALLHEDLPPRLASTEIGVNKNTVQGMAYRVEQDFDRSAASFALAERLATDSYMPLLSEVLNRRGALKFDEKKYAEAKADYQRALELSRRFNRRDQEASALVSLARVATIQERFDESIDRGLAALQLSRSLDMQGLVATTQGNLGWYYFQLGDFESALDSYRQAAETSERIGLTGYAIYWLTGVANAYEAIHDYQSAETLAKNTLGRARGLNNAQTITECLNDLARFALEAERPDEAEQYIQEALKMEAAGADHFGLLESSLLSARIQSQKRDFTRAENLFRRILQAPDANTPLRWEAQAGLARMHDDAGLPAAAEREYRQSVDTIEAARASINRDELRLSFLSGGIELYDSFIDFLIRHGRPMDALKIAEQSRARTLEEGLASAAQATPLSPRHLHPQEIAQKSKASLLFYWIGQKNSHLWVITAAKTSHFKLPPASVIDPVVAEYRKALLRMHDAQDDGSAEGKKLYAMLVEPAKKLVPPGSQVIVLPSESLYGLNFETLIVPDPQPHFWIEDVTLTTGSSLTMLAASATQPLSKDKSLFLVGDTKPPNPPFAPLPQAAEEMKQVKKYFPGAQTRVLEGERATPSAFLRSNPEQFSYLHFVTHGTASHTRPLESAVILSQEGDSYKLYARDIVQHRLNANLVTISACNGAGTRAYSGEGLVGLSWAFLRAGAHNVIGALWEVSDASTPQLMDAFYRELFQGKSTATALRDAKLGLLHSADPDSVFKNPFYWAPFQLYAGS